MEEKSKGTDFYSGSLGCAGLGIIKLPLVKNRNQNSPVAGQVEFIFSLSSKQGYRRR